MPDTAICGLFIATSGLQGASLGSDEHNIVLLGYAVIDPSSNQILGVQEYLVQPSNCDLNSNFLSESVKQETRLTEAAIRTSGVPLQKAISLFETYSRSLNVEPSTIRMATDGQLPLRQCLHPESTAKDIPLPTQYNAFCDLRKDVARVYGAGDAKFSSIAEMLTFLDVPNSCDTSFFSKELRDMTNIIQRLISDGYKFTEVETIQLYLEPGICSKDEEVDSNCVVRARGLPWQSSDQDIAKFFRGLNIAKGGVALCLSPVGRRNGEALVRFESQEHRDMALKRHRHHMGSRYIEVYRAPGEDFVNVAGGANNEAQAFLTKGAQVIIRMRGLPYDCTARQVIEFFENGEKPVKVMDGEEGILFVTKPDGKSTGDAFVLFKEEKEVANALARHRECIGTRYIELFRSTTAEVQQVLNRAMTQGEPMKTILPPLPHPSMTQLPILPQHLITSGTLKDCIRLRGLPYEAQVEHILEFLGEHAKNIVFQGVHMVYNSQHQPSGEAFIQMNSEASAYNAAQLRHYQNMSFGKKKRYVEVFQCSGDDMMLVLSGGLPLAPQLSPPGSKPSTANAAHAAATSLLSPGIYDYGAGGASAAELHYGFPGISPTLLPPPPQSAAAAAAAQGLFVLPKFVVPPLKRTWNQAFIPTGQFQHQMAPYHFGPTPKYPRPVIQTFFPSL